MVIDCDAGLGFTQFNTTFQVYQITSAARMLVNRPNISHVWIVVFLHATDHSYNFVFVLLDLTGFLKYIESPKKRGRLYVDRTFNVGIIMAVISF